MLNPPLWLQWAVVVPPTHLANALTALFCAAATGTIYAVFWLGKRDARLDAVETALNKLEVKVDSGFDKVDSRFDKMDLRFDKMDSKFDELRREQRSDMQQLRRELRADRNTIIGVTLALTGLGGLALYQALKPKPK